MNNYEHSFLTGAIKQAAAYGLSRGEAVTLIKASAEDGPYSLQQAANAAADEIKLKAMVHNRKNHPGHYWMNPFVEGPLSELGTRLSRRMHQGSSGKGGWVGGQIPLAALFADHDSKRETIKKLLAEKLQSTETGFKGTQLLGGAAPQEK